MRKKTDYEPRKFSSEELEKTKRYIKSFSYGLDSQLRKHDRNIVLISGLNMVDPWTLSPEVFSLIRRKALEIVQLDDETRKVIWFILLEQSVQLDSTLDKETILKAFKQLYVLGSLLRSLGFQI